MIPFAFPFGLFLLLLALRWLFPTGARYRMADAAAWSLSAMLLLTGGAHFVGLRQDMIRMVPPVLPRPDLLVTISGALEWLGAALFVPRATRALAGIALAALFVALLPANIYAALAGISFAGQPPTPLLIRVPEQLIYVGFALVPALEVLRSKGATSERRLREEQARTVSAG